MIYQKYKIKKIVKDVNYYGSIELEVENIEGKELLISFDPEGIEPQWCSIVETGIRLVYWKFVSDRQMGLQVKVKNLHTMLFDSTPAIVLYITVRCLEDALGEKKDLVILDESTGHFVFKR
jgi:hypothetical protein